MFFSADFWMVIAIAFCVLRLVATTARARALVLALAGLAGIALLTDMAPLSWAVLGLSIGSVLLGAKMLTRGQARYGIAVLAIAPVGIAWVLGKAGQALEIGHVLPLLFVGISYLLLKAWTLLKDILDGKITDVEPVELLAYFLHLPTLVLGPMHQFSEFKASLDRPYVFDAERAIDCAFRFTLGLFKVNVLAGLLAPASLTALVGAEGIGLIALIKAAFVYSLVLYLDFSGFCDMAIATSRLLGVEVPENFKWPYLATSMREFWRRWHITFSRALTAHVFLPLSRVLARRFPDAPGRVTTIGYLLTFAFCGYWHGPTLNFVLWGLWHALGLIAQDIHLRRLRARGGRPVITKPLWMRVRDTAAVFTFVSIGWILFVLPVGTLLRITGL